MRVDQPPPSLQIAARVQPDSQFVPRPPCESRRRREVAKSGFQRRKRFKPSEQWF
jgi:hypothetical protein